MKTQTTWFILADAEGAKLVRSSELNGRTHLEEVSSFTNRWKAPQNEPPTSLSSPKSEHSYGSLGHVVEEHERRFANHLAQWIEQVIREQRVDEVFLFASAHLHGCMRKAYTPATIRHVRERMGDIAHESLSQLMRHPALQNLVA